MHNEDSAVPISSLELQVIQLLGDSELVISREYNLYGDEKALFSC
jgi:hypothetical protein